MADGTIELAQITLAADAIEKMVGFYDAVFGTGLQPVSVEGDTLYRGTLLGVTFVICPNSLAGVEAEQSRHQFSYTVADLAGTVERALAAGGTLHDEAQAGDAEVITLLDPDGNSIVLVEAVG